MTWLRPKKFAKWLMIAYVAAITVLFATTILRDVLGDLEDLRSVGLEILTGPLLGIAIVMGPVVLLARSAMRTSSLSREIVLLLIEVFAVLTMATIVVTTYVERDAQGGIAIMMVAVAQYLVVLVVLGAFKASDWFDRRR